DVAMGQSSREAKVESLRRDREDEPADVREVGIREDPLGTARTIRRAKILRGWRRLWRGACARVARGCNGDRGAKGHAQESAAIDEILVTHERFQLLRPERAPS